MLGCKKKADTIPVLVVYFVFAVQIIGCFLTPLYCIPLFLLVLYLGGTTSVLQHHHGHCSIFTPKWKNDILDLTMSLQSGITPYAWILHHNIGHHGNYMTQYPETEENKHKIDASNWTREDGSVMNRWEYVFYNRKRMHERCTEIGQKSTKIFTQYRKYRYITFLLTAVLLTGGFVLGCHPISLAMMFVVLPQIMVLMVFETTYDHHSGLFTENKYEASRNIVTSYYNFMRLNLGYHTAHHVRPHVHWSELPQYHESIRSQIPNELISAEEGFVQSSKKTLIS